MKLQQPLKGDYDPETKVLRISGRNSLGKESHVDLPIEDENVFFGWLTAVLHEKSYTTDGGGKALVAHNIGFGLHQQPDGLNVASFTFTCGEIKLSFLAGIETKDPARLAAIQAHLEQALLEMGHSRSTTKQ